MLETRFGYRSPSPRESRPLTTCIVPFRAFSRPIRNPYRPRPPLANALSRPQLLNHFARLRTRQARGAQLSEPRELRVSRLRSTASDLAPHPSASSLQPPPPHPGQDAQNSPRRSKTPLPNIERLLAPSLLAWRPDHQNSRLDPKTPPDCWRSYGLRDPAASIHSRSSCRSQLWQPARTAERPTPSRCLQASQIFASHNRWPLPRNDLRHESDFAPRLRHTPCLVRRRRRGATCDSE